MGLDPHTRDTTIAYAAAWCKQNISKICYAEKDKKSLNVLVTCGEHQIKITDEEIRDMRKDAMEQKLQHLKRSVE